MNLDPVMRGRIGLGIAIFVALLLLGPFVFNTDARHLSAYREGDEDASSFRAVFGGSADAFVATPHALADVEDPEGSLLVVLGAERRYDASEARAVVTFLRGGGNVLLADESGYGTAIAKEAGFAFATQRVLDTRNHLGDPNLVDATVRVDEQSYRVLFNKPTHLVALPEALPHEVLARSSEAQYPQGSYVDTDGDGEIGRGDEPGPFILAVRVQVGAGTLVLVSDTGPFMNRQMSVAEFDNEAFVGALAAGLTGPDGRVYVDESRHAPPPHLALFDNAMRTTGRLLEGDVAWLVLLVLFGGVALAWRYTRATQDWSHHDHSVDHEMQVPPEVRPDVERVQRFARRRISEKYNIPMEQVQAMTAEQLVAARVDRALAEAAGGAIADPASFFRSNQPTEASQ